MSKLSGNERWKTKMLLSEHVEQYEQQDQKEENSGNMLTNAERLMIRDLILLPYIDTMVSKSMVEIERSGNLLMKMYIMAGRYIQNRIMRDTWELQKELKQRNVRFVADEQDEFISYYKIFFRGYQEQFGLTRDVMRSEISLRLTRYTAELGKLLKEHLK
ncbi:hypothetical protein KIH86_15305 [Paenibacillus sp. HN-1]|uniref:hypothetical protein n=1 Tax=Paenibacillus TaxID=44249 RepID=UPI001CAA2858|nr:MULTISPECIES: hypothetical protein [Paenibacillus]MBY9079508.1 hypothetical protein [Paenibacillus sp. CGMCC 1.18879]MBY9085597.1 hypothetical protein [Paenibacillus sinensis]